MNEKEKKNGRKNGEDEVGKRTAIKRKEHFK